ncbi:unnamed protein product [Clavelina lepadiformis]|uniref:Uncharacterized protein n=1 Tax=Clavelina lepadiformis TaxID=159417 RepID=A0ABP0GEZ9_CLALP
MDPLTARRFAAVDCSGQRFAFRVVPPRYQFPYLPLSSVPSSTVKLAKVSTEDDFKTKATYQSSLYEKCCRLAYTTQQCSTSEPDAEECNQNARSLSSLVRTDDESEVGDWDGGREKRAAALTIS